MIGWVNILLLSNISYKRDGVDAFGQIQTLFFISHCYIHRMMERVYQPISIPPSVSVSTSTLVAWTTSFDDRDLNHKKGMWRTLDRGSNPAGLWNKKDGWIVEEWVVARFSLNSRLHCISTKRSDRHYKEESQAQEHLERVSLVFCWVSVLFLILLRVQLLPFFPFRLFVFSNPIFFLFGGRRWRQGLWVVPIHWLWRYFRFKHKYIQYPTQIQATPFHTVLILFLIMLQKKHIEGLPCFS